MLNGYMNNTPVRSISAKVELYNGSTLANTFKSTDKLKSFTVDRVGDNSKFFGFGICQKANIKLIDPQRQLAISTANSFKTYLVNTAPHPTFYVTEVNRDEKTNQLSITAYDLLNNAASYTVEELGVSSYTVFEFAQYCASIIGAKSVRIIGVSDSSFDLFYENGANFDGTETIRTALNAIAELTQTIYYIDNTDNLVFKRLDLNGEAVLEINKNLYFDLDSKTNRRLVKIVSATELGDNIAATVEGVSGTTQYIRNNPFLDLREDRTEILNNALANVYDLTINQFECNWRGNYLLEIGDKINLVTKNNKTVTSYILDDSITYDGGFEEKTQWTFSAEDEENAATPSTLTEVIKTTYARVDKVNKQIDIVAAETSANGEAVAALQLNTESLSASVTKVQEDTTTALEGVSEDIATLTSKVEATITAEAVELAIKNEMANGVTKVETETGFTFNEEGLTVTKSDSEMETTITENGMIIYKNEEEVLVANNVGVQATNLHANTYLIIGSNSRFEDYNGGTRTGCFWIG